MNDPRAPRLEARCHAPSGRAQVIMSYQTNFDSHRGRKRQTSSEEAKTPRIRSAVPPGGCTALTSCPPSMLTAAAVQPYGEMNRNRLLPCAQGSAGSSGAEELLNLKIITTQAPGHLRVGFGEATVTTAAWRQVLLLTLSSLSDAGQCELIRYVVYRIMQGDPRTR